MNNSSYIDKIANVLSQTDLYPYIDRLVDEYQFNFNFSKIFNPQWYQIIKGLVHKFIKVILYQHIYHKIQKTQIQLLKSMIAQTVLQLQEQYCKLIQKNLSKKKTDNLQLYIFIIALASKQILGILIPYIDDYRPSEESKNQGFSNQVEQQNKFNIQDQAYIIIIYHTLGKLISPLTFNKLKKKYIKQSICKLSLAPSIRQVQRSMKIIKDNIIKNEYLAKSRIQRRGKTQFLSPLNQFRSEIKQSLKIKQPVTICTTHNNDKKIISTLKLYNNQKNRKLDIYKKSSRRKFSFEATSSSAKLWQSQSKRLFSKINKIDRIAFKEAPKNIVKQEQQKKQVPQKVMNIQKKCKFVRLDRKLNRTQRGNWDSIISKLKLSSQRQFGLPQKLSQYPIIKKMQQNSKKQINIRNTYNQRLNKMQPIIKSSQKIIENSQKKLDYKIISDHNSVTNKYIKIHQDYKFSMPTCFFHRLDNQQLKKTDMKPHKLKKDRMQFSQRCSIRKQKIDQIQRYYRV